MFLKFRNHDHWFLSHVNSISCSEIFYGSPLAQWDSKGYKVFFKNNSFEEDVIVFKTNSCHLLFRQLKNVHGTYYESVIGHE